MAPDMMNTFLALMLGTLIGFIPTFGILFLVTTRYERKIQEEDTMKTFVIGIFVGILVTLGHLFVINDLNPENTGPFVIYAYLLALAEGLIWRIYIRRKKFRDRPDRPFIILSFSLGISGLFLLFTSGQLLAQFDTNSPLFVAQIMGFALFAIAISTMRGGMALLLVRGELSGRSLIPMAIITVVYGSFNLFSMIYLAYEFFWTFAALLVPAGLIVFAIFYSDLKKVPNAVIDQ
jgi:MFS family permease